MRFMLIVKATEYTETGVKYSRKYTDAVNAYKKSLARAGVLLATEELQPSSNGIRILYPLHGGEPEVIAGPFTVGQELIAGYTLIDVSSEDEAAEWALQMPFPEGFGVFEIEMRMLEEETETIHDPRTLAMAADLEDQINMLKK
ncbi:YciI family protein [Metabacillus arenae]|uniref:YciI family protein n=1 Tax=Metabacillus arenae TaxID=2771434 RepID=A0A926RVZ8_9BACI|nr:YciI family protein [Metabacillus arenae]MBD1379426.1 YciI family protein [Metabacillus arenae]